LLKIIMHLSAQYWRSLDLFCSWCGTLPRHY